MTKFSLCALFDFVETGAVSTDHPAHPRVQKERERDRGLRFCRPIIIETYTNRLWLQEHEHEHEHEQDQDQKQEEKEEEEGEEAADPVMSDSVCPLSTEPVATCSPRERTPFESDGQCERGISASVSASASSELPKEIAFFSGNPSVEVTNGIIHLYKKK